MKKIRIFFTAMVLTLFSFAASAQNINVSGSVVDGVGDPVVGANVILQGSTTVYALTDADGSFKLSVPSNGTIVVSSLGYLTQAVEVNGRKNIQIILEEDSQLLDETIVVAFGTTTKEAFTGSATVMKSDELAKRQTTNVANALVGNVPGLQMKGASGAPGASSGVMNIRGLSSLYSNTEPLIIVDGSPYPASLSNIPQSDIESITVLKDAASAALYGARGASGVILITTKRARSSEAVVTLDAKVGVSSRAIQDYNTITDPREYYEAYYDQLNNYYLSAGQDASTANLSANAKMISDLGYNIYTVPEGQNLIGLNGKLNPNATLGRSYVYNGETYYMTNDNWRDVAYKNALRQEYNVSVNGGNKRASYYASVNYLNEDGIIEYSGYERISARLKADYQAKKWLKIAGNIGYTNSTTTSNPNMSESELGSTNLMYYTSMIAPIYPIYVRVLDENGNPIIRTDSNGNPQYDYGVAATNYGVGRAFLQTGNPLGSNRYNTVFTKGNQLNGNLSANIDFTDHLHANISSTIIWGNTAGTSYDNGLYGPKVGPNGELYKSNTSSLRTNNIQTLTYNNSFGPINVNVMAGHEYYRTNSSLLSATAQGAFSPEVLEIAAFANKQVTSNSYSTNYNVEGYFVSAQVDDNNTFYLSASFRRDASSYFAPKHRWGNFWSVGAAYVISKELFMQNATWIDLLKLKASIGQQGNDNTAAFGYTDTYNLTASSDKKSMVPSYRLMGNPEITWETTTNSNVGLEFSFFNGRIAGGLDAYYKKTTNQLFWISIPESAGSRGYYGNVGDIANYGLELNLSVTPVKTRLVQWDVNMNISTNKGKILSLPEAKIRDNGGYYEAPYWYEVGGELNNFMTYAYAGVNEKGEALYYYDKNLSPKGGLKDDNGDAITNNVSVAAKSKDGTTTLIGEASRYATGTNLPKFYGGFGTSLQIGDFDLSVTFDYQLGGKIYDNRYSNLMSPVQNAQGAGSTFHKDWVNSWSATNKESNLPRWQYGDRYSSYGDRWLTNASYLNFQSFAVGYNLPLKKIFHMDKYISKIRFYVLGENLGFISARQGLDPRYSFEETSSMNVYSPVRTISGGIQVTF
ncbi:MAG: SusC/RagA family TonB-linked outer membrane protein [Bacteroidales bacterium]|nr:SusC/RagA family TonB-linked outer membrane protein [Bacteroidales bacterium]